MASASDDINVLLLGQTGVGKSTFINAFANHLIYNSLTAASTGEPLCALPVNFHIQNSDTYELQEVKFGKSHKNEKHFDVGHSVTQACQAHIFKIGNRILRLIDAPGIGDVRGVRQDEQNLQHILDFISQYKYLKGICILFKPDETRLNVSFKYCVKELLTRLHRSAANNIMFVFTNAKTTFYAPGSTSILLHQLLKEVNTISNSAIPFNRSNTYCIDNEGFRYAIAMKFGLRFPSEQVNQYSKSWEESEKQYIRLFETVMKCEPHLVLDTKSINAAEQYIRLLARPISEVSRLIAENIRFAEQAENQARTYSPSSSLSNPLIQKHRNAVSLLYPMTICTSKKCASIEQDGKIGVQVVYTQRCHETCYLRKVQQEVLGDPALLRCQAFERRNKRTELCCECGCSYRYHMHITYETRTSYTESKYKSITSIRSHIEKLKKEERIMIDASAQFSTYLEAHAIAPCNDAFIDYIQLFIREEEQKSGRSGAPNLVLQDLKELCKQYEKQKERFLYKNHLRSDHETKFTRTSEPSCDLTPDSVFELIYKLQELPISGPFIVEQIKILDSHQHQFTKVEENEIPLSNFRSESMAMKQLKEIFSVKSRRYYDYSHPESSVF